MLLSFTKFWILDNNGYVQTLIIKILNFEKDNYHFISILKVNAFLL